MVAGETVTWSLTLTLGSQDAPVPTCVMEPPTETVPLDVTVACVVPVTVVCTPVIESVAWLFTRMPFWSRMIVPVGPDSRMPLSVT